MKHPNYNSENKYYDFALVKLKKKLEWSDKIDYLVGVFNTIEKPKKK